MADDFIPPKYPPVMAIFDALLDMNALCARFWLAWLDFWGISK
jgi:hypothetical protein